jgi:hypothetical protein
LHASKHLGSRKDGAGAPAQHVQVCLDCAAHAPLTGAHGSPAHALLVAIVSAGALRPIAGAALASARPVAAFQARAPPR